MKSQVIDRLPLRVYLALRWWDYRLNRNALHAKDQIARQRETRSASSYKPFDDKQAIFVHIPKCAGIAVNHALFGNLAGGHTTLDHYIDIFEPGAFQRYFKFTFVRNPWDRLVSAYHFLKAGGMNRWDKDFYARELSHLPDFRSFVLEWLKPDKLYRHHHFTPQYHYLFDRYFKVGVDYIGQLENIESDFSEVARCIGTVADLGRANRSRRSDYKDYYDQETREHVALVYAADISLLGYTFEGLCACPRRIDPRAARATIEAFARPNSW